MSVTFCVVDVTFCICSLQNLCWGLPRPGVANSSQTVVMVVVKVVRINILWPDTSCSLNMLLLQSFSLWKKICQHDSVSQIWPPQYLISLLNLKAGADLTAPPLRHKMDLKTRSATNFKLKFNTSTSAHSLPPEVLVIGNLVLLAVAIVVSATETMRTVLQKYYYILLHKKKG